MTTVFDRRTGLAVLDRDECVTLLATQQVGRIAVVVGGRPLVFPVNYIVDGENVVFRTGIGTKLTVAGRGPVCFEVDEIDGEAETGWSVMVGGRLEEVTAADGARLAHVRELGVRPWTDAPKDHWMRVVSSSITGRRIQKR